MKLDNQPPSGIIFAPKFSKIYYGSWPMELAERNLGSEKRKYPRFDVDLPIKYSRGSFFFKYARAVNASEGGLLLHLPEELGSWSTTGV